MSTEKKNAKEKEEEVQDLSSFTWDNNETFFGVETPKEKSSVDTVIEEVEEVDEDADKDKEGEDKSGKTKQDKKEKTEDEEEPFAEKTEEDDDEEGDDKDDVKFFTELTKEFKQKGLFSTIELNESDEVSEEKFFELHDAEIDNRADERVKEVIAELGTEGKQWYDFVKAGGKSEDFFKVYGKVSEIPTVDIETEDGQDKLLRYYYENYEMLDTDDVTDRLDWLKESGKKQKQAEKVKAKIESDIKEKREQLLRDQKDQKEKLEKNRDKFVNDIKSTAEKLQTVNDFTFSVESKKVLPDYIAKSAVKVGTGYITQFQNDLNEIIRNEDKTQLLLLAELIRSKFDFSSVAKQAATKTTKTVKTVLSETRQGKLSSASGSKSRSLSDYFS